MRKNILWILVILLLILTLISCSSSSGSVADTMTVTISDPSGTATTAYTEHYYSEGQAHFDPYLISYSTSSYTTIYLFSYTPWTMIEIQIKGNTPGSFPVNATDTSIFYQTDNQYLISQNVGTITLQSIGNVGDKISGSYEAVFTSGTSTNISGYFSVTRELSN